MTSTPLINFDDNAEIPSFLPARFLKPESIEGLSQRLEILDRRIAWLAERGLRAHPDVLARRDELLEKIALLEEPEHATAPAGDPLAHSSSDL